LEYYGPYKVPNYIDKYGVEYQIGRYNGQWTWHVRQNDAGELKTNENANGIVWYPLEMDNSKAPESKRNQVIEGNKKDKSEDEQSNDESEDPDENEADPQEDNNAEIIAPEFINPTSGIYTSAFGIRDLEVNDSFFHHGIDIANRVNTPILASRGGSVVSCGWSDTLGWNIRLRHDNGIDTIYAHLNINPNIAVGTLVDQGDVIGRMGNSGIGTGPHLHFAMVVPTRELTEIESLLLDNDDGFQRHINPGIYLNLPEIGALIR